MCTLKALTILVQAPFDDSYDPTETVTSETMKNKSRRHNQDAYDSSDKQTASGKHKLKHKLAEYLRDDVPYAELVGHILVIASWAELIFCRSVATFLPAFTIHTLPVKPMGYRLQKYCSPPIVSSMQSLVWPDWLPIVHTEIAANHTNHRYANSRPGSASAAGGMLSAGMTLTPLRPDLRQHGQFTRETAPIISPNSEWVANGEKSSSAKALGRRPEMHDR